MALKNWKKDEEWFKLGRPTWEKDINGEKYLLQILIPSAYMWKFEGDGKKKWLAWRRGPDGIERRKYFATKRDALKYAGEYMRTH